MRQAAFVIVRYPRVFCWMRTIAVGIEWQAVYCNLTLHVHCEWLLAVLINAGSFYPISQSLTQPLTQSILWPGTGILLPTCPLENKGLSMAHDPFAQIWVYTTCI